MPKGKIPSKETRMKMSIAQTGKKHTLETRAKISAITRGRIRSPEAKAKTSASLMGHPVSEETKKRISMANKGKTCSPETRKKISKSRENIVITQETRKKLSIALKGKKLTSEVIAKMSKAQKGRIITAEHAAKLSAALSGEKSPNWRGGISFEPYCPKWNNDLRTRIRAFFDHRCILCGKNEHDNGKRKMSCHHVEYNKQACCDGKPVCFAALCHTHHLKTNHDRQRWESMLHRIIDEIYDGRSYFTKEEYASILVRRYNDRKSNPDQATD